MNRGADELVRIDGELFARFRLARGLSEEQLAARAAVSVALVRRAQAGFELESRALARLAAVLRVAPQDLAAKRTRTS